MDFTIKPNHVIVVRFNGALVMELNLNMREMSISGTITDEFDDATYLISGSVQAGE